MLNNLAAGIGHANKTKVHLRTKPEVAEIKIDIDDFLGGILLFWKGKKWPLKVILLSPCSKGQ